MRGRKREVSMKQWLLLIGIMGVCAQMQAVERRKASSRTQAVEQLVYEIRNPATGPARFRAALERIGEYLALNVIDDLDTEEAQIRTLTGADATHDLVSETPVIVTILRAGFPLSVGVQRVFPDAPVGFLAMSRNEETLEATVEYVALPDLRGRSVIITDTMLATGGSLSHAIDLVQGFGPKRIYCIVAIASEPGLECIDKNYPHVEMVIAETDPELNERGFIVPGLGDAGDRLYGLKCTKSVSSLQVNGDHGIYGR
jgi:uracil phosphoribosyltransferase